MSTRTIMLAMALVLVTWGCNGFEESSPVTDDGACCLSDGTCSMLTEVTCAMNDGRFQGLPSACASASCTFFCNADPIRYLERPTIDQSQCEYCQKGQAGFLENPLKDLAGSGPPARATVTGSRYAGVLASPDDRQANQHLAAHEHNAIGE